MAWIWILICFSYPVFANAIERAECRGVLGMANGEIQDEQLTASSDGGKVKDARLNGNGAWRGNDMNIPWIQVSFIQLTNISGIATQGNPDQKGKNEIDEYITEYRIEYTLDGLLWNNVTESNDSTLFAGNSDRNTVVKHVFLEPVTVRSIRVFPTAKHDAGDRYSLRMELYGCQTTGEPDCLDALGMADGAIPDEYLFANSDPQNVGNARLFGEGKWEPMGSLDIWFQVNFMEYTATIVGIAVQGREGGMVQHDGFVQEFMLQYSSVDGGSFNSTYITNDEHRPVFTGSQDRHTPVFQMFSNPVNVRLLRIIPTLCKMKCILRFELYGCQVQPTTALQITEDVPSTRSDVSPTSNTYVNTLSPSFQPLSSQQTSPSVESSSAIGIIVGVILALVLIIGIFGLAVVWIRKRRKGNKSTTTESGHPKNAPGNANRGAEHHNAAYESVTGGQQANNIIYAQGSEEGGNGEEKVNEGWEDNGIYASENDEEGQDPNKAGEKTEGWGDNDIYASTEENEIDQEEGWKDNTIYAGGET